LEWVYDGEVLQCTALFCAAEKIVADQMTGPVIRDGVVTWISRVQFDMLWLLYFALLPIHQFSLSQNVPRLSSEVDFVGSCPIPFTYDVLINLCHHNSSQLCNWNDFY
jgi:hypothetical protein